MKTKAILKTVFLIFIILFQSFPVLSEETETADIYIHKVINPCSTIQPIMWDYVKTSAHSKDSVKIEIKYDKLLKKIAESQKEISKIDNFKGDESLKDSAQNYLKSLYLVLTQNYAQLIDMKKISEESYDKMKTYLIARERAGEKLQKVTDEFTNQQMKFAKKNNFELSIIQDDIYKKLQIAIKVDRYYKKIYLIFFKPYKQEFYCLNAISSQNQEAIKQNREKLLKESKEALKMLNKIKPYENRDATLTNAVKQILEFYVEEANNDFKTTSNFFLIKAEFDTAKNSLETKKTNDSKITQDDIDQYNLKVKEFNDIVNKMNNAVNKSNSQRSKLINNLNKISFEFYNSNVPK